MHDKSTFMKLFCFLGLDSIAWSLRRLYCPVSRDALVLEVGSGGNPYFRANVLLDAYAETRERHWEPLITDRPTVLGFVENLPFKNKVFDFVIASHVLEHSSDPDAFLGELQRVAKAGYIEVPDAFMERINPYLDHRLEITERDERLIIRKKPAHQVDPELVELYEHKANEVIAGETMRRHPFHFHVRYYWADKIDYEILTPEVDAAWPAPETAVAPTATSLRARINKLILSGIRRVFSQVKRNRNIRLAELMQCPLCGSDSLAFHEKSVDCEVCNQRYPVIAGVPNMSVDIGRCQDP